MAVPNHMNGDSVIDQSSESDSKSKSKKSKKSHKSHKSDKKRKHDSTTEHTDKINHINGLDTKKHRPIDDGLNAIQSGEKALGPPLSEFRINSIIQSNLQAKNITVLFPIQVATFNYIYDNIDVMGRARTGTGKTLAFALPICCKLIDTQSDSKLSHGRHPRVLVLTPTRELAKQIEGEFNMITSHLTILTVYGGTPYPPQQAALRRGVDVVVGTCGRIKDLLERGQLMLDQVKHVIMDEADEMLNMGFADDVELILKSVKQINNQSIQTLLFSATIPAWVNNVAKKYLKPDRQYIDLVGNTNQQANSDITHYAVSCHWSERNSVLRNVIDVYGASGSNTRTIIFCETKRDCNELAMSSTVASDCQVIHGDISQSQRESTLKGFRDGNFNILVATDVAARGIDISGVELVIQCEPPKEVETYIHRSGRTGRAGMKGSSLIFYTPKHLFYLNQIERVAKVSFKRVGIPGGNEIISSAAKLAMNKILSVNHSVIPLFIPYAKSVIEQLQGDHQMTIEQIVAACIAQSTGTTEPIKQRSLLSSTQGNVTVHMKYHGAPIRSLTFVWTMIKRHLFENADTKVKSIKLTKDKSGAVFDISESDADIVKKCNTGEQSLTFELCTDTLPELDTPSEAPPSRFGGGGRGGFSRGGGGRSFGGGRGGGGFRGRR